MGAGQSGQNSDLNRSINKKAEAMMDDNASFKLIYSEDILYEISARLRGEVPQPREQIQHESPTQRKLQQIEAAYRQKEDSLQKAYQRQVEILQEEYKAKTDELLQENLRKNQEMRVHYSGLLTKAYQRGYKDGFKSMEQEAESQLRKLTEARQEEAQQQELKLVQRVQSAINSIDKSFLARVEAQRAPVPCGLEKSAVFDCYKNQGNPLLCADLVRSFNQCARNQTQSSSK
eukprot:TRINITY_DN1141_c0_g1_i1.p1 TRINITY_DN1141_c0_g1~~TRINITY_DN1141_c0_g1_i1.p1  ORF type:complete len:232 (+),score=46.26 TRINITY_DN1141_c0_g1_i1:79-774(+)